MYKEIGRTEEFKLFEFKRDDLDLYWRKLKLTRVKRLKRGEGRNIFYLAHNGKRFAMCGDFYWLVENRLPMIAWISNVIGGGK